MIIGPILFSTLVMGIAGHGDDLKKVGRLAFRSILYFEIVTTVALMVGLARGEHREAGRQPAVDAALLAAEAAQAGPKLAAPKSFGDHVREVVPTSFFDAMATNNVLQIVFFSILFASALTQVRGAPKQAILSFAEGLAEAMFKVVGIIMKFVPIAVGAALAVTVSHSGLTVLLPLLKLVVTLWGALIVFVLVALLPVALLARIPIRGFIRQVREPAIIAFSTTSSDAALPLAMQRMEAFGVPRRIVVVRDADGVLVQPRRLDALSRARVGVRRPGGGGASVAGDAGGDDADAHAHEQGRRGGAARIARDPLRHAHRVRPPARRRSR